MGKILNIGSLNLDYVYAVPHFAAAGETLLSAGRQVFAGGKGLNQSVAAARAGAKVLHCGAVGQEGEGLLQLLRDSGANVSNVALVKEPTGHAIIQVAPGGENCIIILGGANRAIPRETVEKALAQTEPGDILMLQNEINDLGYIIEAGAKRGLRILFNPAPMEEKVKELPLELVWCLIVNEGEGKALAGDGAALKKAFPGQRILLTHGGKGAELLYKEERCFMPAFKVNAVDTTAAGDCFAGYFAAALAEELPTQKALALAAAASAIAVGRPGAAPSIPLRTETEAFLSRQGQ